MIQNFIPSSMFLCLFPWNLQIWVPRSRFLNSYHEISKFWIKSYDFNIHVLYVHVLHVLQEKIQISRLYYSLSVVTEIYSRLAFTPRPSIASHLGLPCIINCTLVYPAWASRPTTVHLCWHLVTSRVGIPHLSQGGHTSVKRWTLGHALLRSPSWAISTEFISVHPFLDLVYTQQSFPQRKTLI